MGCLISQTTAILVSVLVSTEPSTGEPMTEAAISGGGPR